MLRGRCRKRIETLEMASYKAEAEKATECELEPGDPVR